MSAGVPRAPSTAAAIAWALSALLATQLVFWLAIGMAESAARPSGMQARPWIEYVAVDAQGHIAADAPRQRAAHEPDPNYKARLEGAPSSVLFEIPFELAAVEGDLALYLGAQRSIQEIRLNGQVIKPNVPLDSFSGAAGWEPVFYMLPVADLRLGQNLVTALVASEGFGHVFPEFQIGPAEAVARAYGYGKLFNIDLPLVAVGILLFTALLCVAVNWPQADRPRVRALILLLLVWALASYAVAFAPPFVMSREATIFAYYSLASAQPFAAALYALHQTGVLPRLRRALPWLWSAAQAWLCLATLVVVGELGDPLRWLSSFPLLSLGATALLATGGIGLLALTLGREGGRHALERGLLMVCLTALLVDAADATLKLHVPGLPALPLTFYSAPLAGLLLGLGMVASLAREATLARRVVATANAVLAERLAVREAELAAVHEREKQLLVRHAALEERQRIVRDMHDGVGGNLLGLQMQLRHGQPSLQRVEEQVSASLADLRLMVDALDAPEAALSEVLIGFERRLREQLQGAGIALNFEVALGEHDPVLGTRVSLHLLRILQEAVSNACRHAQPRHLQIRARASAGALQLSVRDDGVGIAHSARSGRGLASMRARAAELGAQLDIRAAQPGTEIQVRLATADHTQAAARRAA